MAVTKEERVTGIHAPAPKPRGSATSAPPPICNVACVFALPVAPPGATKTYALVDWAAAEKANTATKSAPLTN